MRWFLIIFMRGSIGISVELYIVGILKIYQFYYPNVLYTVSFLFRFFFCSRFQCSDNVERVCQSRNSQGRSSMYIIALL